MPPAKACDFLNREQLKGMKILQYHPKFRVRTKYKMPLAADAKEKISHKQVYENLLAGKWLMAEASSNRKFTTAMATANRETAISKSDRDGPRPRTATARPRSRSSRFAVEVTTAQNMHNF